MLGALFGVLRSNPGHLVTTRIEHRAVLAFALAERPVSAAAGAPADASGVDLEALIKRIDQTLGADGQLL